MIFFYKKRHNCVTAQRIFNWFCQDQITITRYRPIHLRIFAESFIKFVRKLRTVYGNQMYLFSADGVCRPMYVCRDFVSSLQDVFKDREIMIDASL